MKDLREVDLMKVSLVSVLYVCADVRIAAEMLRLGFESFRALARQNNLRHA